MSKVCHNLLHYANVKGVSHALPRSSMLIKNKTEQQSGFNYFRKGVLEIRLSRMQRACQYCFTTHVSSQNSVKIIDSTGKRTKWKIVGGNSSWTTIESSVVKEITRIDNNKIELRKGEQIFVMWSSISGVENGTLT